MPVTRVYLPLTPGQLAALASGAEVGPAPLRGHGVTPALGRPGLTTDEEELEHQAWTAAAEEASEMAAGGRRVVAAADVDTATVRVLGGVEAPSRIELTAGVALQRIVSFHVEERAGGTGTADLLWYDATELTEVRALVAG